MRVLSMTSVRVAVVLSAWVVSAGCLPDFGAEYCLSDPDCPNGQFCFANTGMAGAADAATVDASSPDAAAPDAVADAAEDAEPDASEDASQDAGPAEDASADAGPAPDARGTAAAILFPPADSLTDDVRATIVGTATAASPIASVRVNGLPVTSNDGFRTWRAEMLLSASTTTVSVDVVPTTGEARMGAVTQLIRRAPMIGRPTAIAVDPEGHALYVLDEARDVVWRVDVDTGDAVVAFSASGNSRSAVISAIAFDRASATLIIAERVEPGREALTAVGPSHAGVWSAADVLPPLADVRAMTIGDGDDLYVLTSTSVVRVARWTGERATAFRFDQVIGAPISDPVSLDWDSGLGELVLLDLPSATFVGVDPNTGVARTLAIVPALLGAEPASLDASAHVAYVAFGAVLLGAYDLTMNGIWLVSREGQRGQGPRLGMLVSLAFDDVGARVFGTEAGRSGVVAVDVATGDRRMVVAVDTPPVEMRNLHTLERNPSADQNMVLVRDPTFPTEPNRQIMWCLPSSRAPISLDYGNALHAKTIYPRGSNSVLLVDAQLGALFSASCGGSLHLVSGTVPGLRSVGQGEPLEGDVIVRGSNFGGARVLSAENMVEVNLATGDRTKVACRWPVTELIEVELVGGEIWAIASSRGTPVLAHVDERCATSPSIAEILPGMGTALAIDPDGARIFVAVSNDAGEDEIWVRSMGTPGLVRVPLDGPGPRVERISGLAWDASRGILWAGDPRLDAVVAIEPATGSTAVIYK